MDDYNATVFYDYLLQNSEGLNLEEVVGILAPRDAAARGKLPTKAADPSQ